MKFSVNFFFFLRYKILCLTTKNCYQHLYNIHIIIWLKLAVSRRVTIMCLCARWEYIIRVCARVVYMYYEYMNEPLYVCERARKWAGGHMRNSIERPDRLTQGRVDPQSGVRSTTDPCAAAIASRTPPTRRPTGPPSLQKITPRF